MSFKFLNGHVLFPCVTRSASYNNVAFRSLAAFAKGHHMVKLKWPFILSTVNTFTFLFFKNFNFIKIVGGFFGFQPSLSKFLFIFYSPQSMIFFRPFLVSFRPASIAFKVNFFISLVTEFISFTKFFWVLTVFVLTNFSKTRPAFRFKPKFPRLMLSKIVSIFKTSQTYFHSLQGIYHMKLEVKLRGT